MAKNFYAVKRGFDKDEGKEVTDLIFTDWKEVDPLVRGYQNARYKGFESEDAAKTWLSVVDKLDGIEATETFVKDSSNKKKGLEYFSSNEENIKNQSSGTKEIMDLFLPAFKALDNNKNKMSLEDKVSILVTINSKLYESLELQK